MTVVSAAKESTEVQVDKQVDKTEKQADNLANQSSPEVRASEESQLYQHKRCFESICRSIEAANFRSPEHDTTKEVLEKPMNYWAWLKVFLKIQQFL